MLDVYKLMGIRKSNTTAYHPQTDGLVERFHHTPTDMLAKSAQQGGKDWDLRLPYVLFAYRTSPQTSTGESPFYLLYGRDPHLPSDSALNAPKDRSVILVKLQRLRNLVRDFAALLTPRGMINLNDYKAEFYYYFYYN